MSDKTDPARRKPPKPEAYAVGYRKPPRETQYKPGQSGNPNGRPKGARNKKPPEGTLAAMVQKEVNRVLRGDGGEEITMGQAFVRKVLVSGVQGSARAQKLSAELIKESERQARTTNERLLDAVMRYKSVWMAELATRAARALTGPAPVPHPDDLVVNPKTQTVMAIGPLTPDQKTLAVAGGPGNETVSSPKRPFVLSGSPVEMALFNNLPREEWRVPVTAADSDRDLDAFKMLCDVLDDAARIKASLARSPQQKDQEE